MTQMSRGGSPSTGILFPRNPPHSFDGSQCPNFPLRELFHSHPRVGLWSQALGEMGDFFFLLLSKKRKKIPDISR